jgi:hypothetical protein
MGHPFFFDMAHARLEFEVTCFSAVQELLTRTGVSPKQIKGVVVNSSLFNPTPSLSAMIMNRFKMGSGTINYNLGGMGCSGEGRRGFCGGVGRRAAQAVEGGGIQPDVRQRQGQAAGHELTRAAGPASPPRPRAASLVAIDLARKVLQLYPNSYVLVVSHENITNNWCGALMGLLWGRLAVRSCVRGWR